MRETLPPKTLGEKHFYKEILCTKWEISQGYPKKKGGYILSNSNIGIWYVVWVHLNTVRNTWGGRGVPCFLSFPKIIYISMKNMHILIFIFEFDFG